MVLIKSFLVSVSLLIFLKYKIYMKWKGVILLRCATENKEGVILLRCASENEEGVNIYYVLNHN